MGCWRVHHRTVCATWREAAADDQAQRDDWGATALDFVAGVGDGLWGAISFPKQAIQYLMGVDAHLGENRPFTFAAIGATWSWTSNPLTRAADTVNHLVYGGLNVVLCGLPHVMVNETLAWNVPYFTPPPRSAREAGQYMTGAVLLVSAFSYIRTTQRANVVTPRGGRMKPEERAATIFDEFVSSPRAKIGRIREDGLTIQDIVPNAPPTLRLTDFTALDDTFLHGQLVSRAVRYLPSNTATTMVDLGAGSCLPTIRALLEHPQYRRLRVIAVDNDAGALHIGQHNVNAMGLAERYQFVRQDMLDFLREVQPANSPQLVVANPPYLPTPPGITSVRGLPLGPIAGGLDGTRFLQPLLQHSYPPGTLLALEWSSLSNPVAIIDLIRARYDVLEVHAARAPFGTYTNSAELRPHLERLRAQGESVFVPVDGQEGFCFVGCILRCR